MKVLIITDSLPPYTTANSAIAMQIADTLTAQYGAEVSFLGYQTGDHTGTGSYRFWEITVAHRYTKAIPEHLSKWKKVLRLALHPEFWRYRMAVSSPRYPKVRDYRQMIQYALRKAPDIDCVMAFICPYDTVYAAAEAVGDIPLVVYKLDPWGTHISHKEERWNWEDEQRTDAACEAIFVTEPIYRDYQCGTNLAPLEKVHMVEFPNLRPPQIRTELIPAFEGGKIHCVYAGQLIAGLRSPDFLFELFRRLEDQNVVLHIIGNTALQAQEYRDRLPANAVLHGIVSAQEAAAYMERADILINIGNTIENQLPSKIITYFSYGKPILNLCKIPNCLTIPYMEKHPLAKTVMEPEGINAEVVQAIRQFMQESYGRRLTFAEMEQIFPTCTPAYVGKQVYDVLCSITKARTARKGS